MNKKYMVAIMRKAIDKYGEKQLDIAQEELAELIQAISKYKRANTPKERDKALINIIEELADVTIMTTQVCYLLNIKNSHVMFKMRSKLRRLDERMEND